MNRAMNSKGKKLPGSVSTDMSPEAIARRLEIASELRTLCLSLARAKKIDGETNDYKKMETDPDYGKRP